MALPSLLPLMLLARINVPPQYLTVACQDNNGVNYSTALVVVIVNNKGPIKRLLQCNYSMKRPLRLACSEGRIKHYPWTVVLHPLLLESGIPPTEWLTARFSPLTTAIVDSTQQTNSGVAFNANLPPPHPGRNNTASSSNDLPWYASGAVRCRPALPVTLANSRAGRSDVSATRL